jgi:hypothetical protein
MLSNGHRALAAIVGLVAVSACADGGPFRETNKDQAPVSATEPTEQLDTQCAMIVRWDPDQPQFPKLVFVGADQACKLSRNAAAKAAKILVDCARAPSESCVTVP